MIDSSFLKNQIQARSLQRHLGANIESVIHFNNQLLKNIPRAELDSVLYVGVGHGQDALCALLEDKVDKIVGVDPYISSDGNDSQDYDNLIKIISHYRLESRLTVFKGTIQDYIKRNPDQRFSAFVLSDVLHHIFVTKQPLSKSRLFSPSIDFFNNLKLIAGDKCRLIISEKTRKGLRPLLSRLGMKFSYADYTTKQQLSEWNKSTRKAGWRRDRIRNYVPFAFRFFKFFKYTPLCRFLICDKYFIYNSIVK